MKNLLILFFVFVSLFLCANEPNIELSPMMIETMAGNSPVRITGMEILSENPVAGSEVHFRIKIKNLREMPFSRVYVTLETKGNYEVIRIDSFNSYEEKKADLKISFEEAGEYEIVCSIIHDFDIISTISAFVQIDPPTVLAFFNGYFTGTIIEEKNKGSDMNIYQAEMNVENDRGTLFLIKDLNKVNELEFDLVIINNGVVINRKDGIKEKVFDINYDEGVLRFNSSYKKITQDRGIRRLFSEGKTENIKREYHLTRKK